MPKRLHRSRTERVRRSSFTTSNASALPVRNIARARSRAGRSSDFADSPASTSIATSSRSYSAA